MKVQELRDLLKASSRDNLEKAFVECYKQLRKAQKEECDRLIADILEGKDVKEAKKEKVVTDFASLEQEIPEFIENAYAQNYFAPNRVIPKNKRPKWRFMVKGYIKALEQIPAEDENHPKAVKLLTDLYVLICTACNYYLFSTDDAFRSIGWNQDDLFRLVVKKTFAGGYTRESISALLLLAATGGLSRESLHIEQELTLVTELKTSDVKYMAIDEAKKLVDERNEKLSKLKKHDSGEYVVKEAINELCNMILMISIILAEPEDAVKYYFKNYRSFQRETTLYCALEVVDLLEDDELWLNVYRYALTQKIEPRQTLKENYEERLKEQQSAKEN